MIGKEFPSYTVRVDPVPVFAFICKKRLALLKRFHSAIHGTVIGYDLPVVEEAPVNLSSHRDIVIGPEAVLFAVSVHKGYIYTVKAVCQREIESEICFCTDFFAYAFDDEFCRRLTVNLQDASALSFCDLMQLVDGLNAGNKISEAFQRFSVQGGCDHLLV